MTQWLNPGRAGTVPVHLGDIFTGLFGGRCDGALHGVRRQCGGAPDAPVGIRLTRPRAASYLATSPSSLGIARAYLQDDLEIEGVHPGNPYSLIRSIDDLQIRTPSRCRRCAGCAAWGCVIRPAGAPAREVRSLALWVSSTPNAVMPMPSSITTNVSNRFYELVLGPSMAYTCACYPSEDATLEQAPGAQARPGRRKLGLQPGMRAARRRLRLGEHGASCRQELRGSVLGVTLSAEQARWGPRAQQWPTGLDHLVRFRHHRLPDVRRAGSTRSARSG